MKKRTAVILTALLIVSLFIFTGCANNDEPMNDGNQGSASQDIERGVDDIGDGIEKGVDDLGDDLSDTKTNHSKTDGSGIENNNRADNVDNGTKNTAN